MNGIKRNYGNNYKVYYALDIISKIFKVNQVPDRYYSIGEYAELAHCLEFSKGKWNIYYGEKGNKNRLVLCDDTDIAIKEFCFRVFPYKEDAESAYNDYCILKKKYEFRLSRQTKRFQRRMPSGAMRLKKATINKSLKRKLMLEKKDIS